MLGHDEHARLAQGILDNRRARLRLLPVELFSEVPWEMLLTLFVADARSKRMTGEKLVEQLGCPPAVASQWLKHLSKVGLIVGDGSGDLTDEVTLSPAGLASIEAHLEHTSDTAAQLVASGDLAADGRARQREGR